MHDPGEGVRQKTCRRAELEDISCRDDGSRPRGTAAGLPSVGAERGPTSGVRHARTTSSRAFIPDGLSESALLGRSVTSGNSDLRLHGRLFQPIGDQARGWRWDPSDLACTALVGWCPFSWCSRSRWRNPSQVAARIAPAGGAVGAHRAVTSGDRQETRSGSYRTAPNRSRQTVIGCTNWRDTIGPSRGIR